MLAEVEAPANPLSIGWRDDLARVPLAGGRNGDESGVTSASLIVNDPGSSRAAGDRSASGLALVPQTFTSCRSLPRPYLDKQAGAAIRQIGTNAIPLYLEMMATRESPLKLKLMALIPRWLARFHSRRFVGLRELNGVYDYRFRGA